MLKINTVIFWNDPEGYSSGQYKICDIYSDSKTVETSDTIIFIRNEAGSEAEVFLHEIEA